MKIFLLVTALLVFSNGVTAQPNSLDTSFNTGSGADGAYIMKSVIQNDGKMVIGGIFDTVDGLPAKNIARLLPNGNIDTSFHVGSGMIFRVITLAIQPDQKILVGQQGWDYNGQTVGRLFRLLPNGNLDPTFVLSEPVNEEVYAIKVMPDGKILVGGYFMTFDGNPAERILKLNADGSLDTSFQVVNGANNSIFSIDVQSDGKIIVVGEFTNYPGVNSKHIARLLPNGLVDTSFHAGTGSTATLNSMKVLPDDKILVTAGSSFNGYTCFGLMRLKADGSIDSSFQTTMDSGGFWDFVLDGQNHIYCGGSGQALPGTNRENRLIRIFENGVIDTTFNFRIGANDNIYGVALQTDGKLIVNGAFSAYNQHERSKIARLFTSCPDTIINYSISVSDTALIVQNQLPLDAVVKWYACATNQLIAQDSSNVFSPSTSGDFYAVVDNFGCSDTTNCIAFESLGITNQQLLSSVKVFPNPAIESLHISNWNKDNASYQLVDIQGKTVQSGSFQNTIDLSELVKGMYVLVLQNSHGIVQQQVVKE
jgi:uncharacterized delta-60 repeat protein